MTTTPLEDIHALNRRTLWAVLAFVLLIGIWAATAPLSSAVVARGVIAVESNTKRVQHSTGGIVSELFVTDGDQVKEGELLLRLDATQARANASVLRAQWISLRAREARLLAERDNLNDVIMPKALAALGQDEAAEQAMAGERSLFRTRREARNGQTKQLRERLGQLAEERQGLEGAAAGRAREAGYLQRELNGVSYLYKKGLSTTGRLVSLQRDIARVQADKVQFRADVARAAGRAGEVELEIIRRQNDFQTEVVEALRDTQVRLAELEERRVAAADTLARLDIRAPRAGVVLGSTAHTLGGVIAPGETVMRIVPKDDPLVIEARVAPRDVDSVAPGSIARVKLLAGNRRTSDPVEGKVLTVSADIMREEQGAEGFFIVRISLNREEAERRMGVKLQSGMMAEAFIATGDRTVVDYLLQPVTDQLARAMRER